jgi:predicted 2-oxoglutarate/Fe(II)-dependent dioxygenase YbiX
MASAHGCFDLDMASLHLHEQVGDNEAIVTPTGINHNLVRPWAET